MVKPVTVYTQKQLLVELLERVERLEAWIVKHEQQHERDRVIFPSDFNPPIVADGNKGMERGK